MSKDTFFFFFTSCISTLNNMSNSLIKNHDTSETSLYFLYSLSICSSTSHSFELCIWLCMSILAFNKTYTICLQANYHLMNWIQNCLFCYLLFVILSILVSSTNFINAFLMLCFELVIKLDKQTNKKALSSVRHNILRVVDSQLHFLFHKVSFFSE